MHLKRKLSYQKVLFENYIFYRKTANYNFPKEIDENKVFLIGTPEYGNLGDHLIAFATLEFLKQVYGYDNVVEVTENNVRYDFGRIYKCIGSTNRIYLQGGGNISDVWTDQENLRKKIIKKFPHNEIVVMPQTVYISNPQNKEKILGKYGNNVAICARERKSFDLICNSGKERVLLCPDMALYLWKYCQKYRDAPKRERNGLGVCIRNDVEASLSMNEKEIEIAGSAIGCDVEMFSTVKSDYILASNRKYEIDNMLNYISTKKIIITDRLHAMLMAYLVGTPCIALANSNGKVEGCYEWIANAENIYFTDNLDDGIAHISLLLDKTNNSEFKYAYKYDDIIK